MNPGHRCLRSIAGFRNAGRGKTTVIIGLGLTGLRVHPAPS